MPPEVPSSRYSHMAFQFRSEFVLTNPDPLNSDMFSGFNYYNSIISGPTKDLRAFEAAQRRLWLLIKQFAPILDQVTDADELGALFCASQDDIRSLRSRLHRRGINMRYIGLLRAYTKSSTIRKGLLQEMLLRTLRSDLCDHLASTMGIENQNSVLQFYLDRIRTGNEEFFQDIFNKIVLKYDYHANGHRIKRFSHILEDLYDAPSSFPPAERENVSQVVNDLLSSTDIASILLQRFGIVQKDGSFTFNPLTKSLSMIPIASAKAQLGHHLLTKSGASFAPNGLNQIVSSLSTCLYTSPDHFDAAWTLMFAHLCQALDPALRVEHLKLARTAAHVAAEISSLSPQKSASLDVFNKLQAALEAWPLPATELSQLASAVIASETIKIDMMVDQSEEFHLAESLLQNPSSGREDSIQLPTNLSQSCVKARLPLIINQFRKPPPFVEITDSSVVLRTDRPVSLPLAPANIVDGALDLFGNPSTNESLDNALLKLSKPLQQGSKPLQGVRIALDPAFVGGIKHKDIDATGVISVRDDDGNIHHLDVGYLNLATALVVKEELETLGAEVLLTRSLERDHAAALDFNEWLDTGDGAGARRAVMSALSPFVLGNPSYRELHGQLSKPQTALKKFLFSSMYLQQHEMSARIDKINAFSPHLTICITYGRAEPYIKEINARGLRNDSSHLLFIPGSLHAGDYVDARGNHNDILSLLCSDRLEKSILFSHLLLRELESETGVPPNPAVDWDASCYVEKGVSTRWLRVPRSVRSPVAYCFFYSANCRDQYFSLLKQVEALHDKGAAFNPATDAQKPVRDVARAISNTCMKFFTLIPPGQNLSVQLSQDVCERFSAQNLICSLDVTEQQLKMMHPDGYVVLSMKFGISITSTSSLPLGDYFVSATGGENSEEGMPVVSSYDGLSGFSRIITLKNSNRHQFSITGAAEISNNSSNSLETQTVLRLHHRDVMVLESLLPVGKFVSVSVSEQAELNSAILKQIETYPTDGTFGYRWNGAGTPGDGTTRILTVNGHILANPSIGETGRALTFCCGLTLEVWLQAALSVSGPLTNIFGTTPSVDALKRLKKLWFVDEPGRLGGPLDALVDFGAGIQVHSLNNAKPGDFIQFWRKSGSGHSVVLIDVVQEEGEIIGFKYWSSQSSTQGIGTKVEYFEGFHEGTVVPSKTYVCRALVPSHIK